MTTVGVVGLGKMGYTFATHLLANGFTVVGYDIDRRRCDELCAQGGAAAESVAELAMQTGPIVTSLPGADSLLAVVDEIGSTGRPVLETSTLAVEVKVRAHELLTANGGTLLDCPVSGTGAQARDRDIVVYASGDHATYERYIAVFDALARAHRHVGELGAGTKLKLIANLLVSVHNVAAAEALVLAKRSGLDPELALDALTQGAGTSRMLEVRGPLMLSENWDESTADLSIYRKDLQLIAEYAASLGAPTPLLRAAADVYATALAEGREHQDAAAVFAVLAAR